MLNKPLACVGCTLYTESKGFSVPEGRCSNKVLIVGESLGSNEVMDNLPFRPYAEAGSVLQTVFRILGYERTNFGMWNMIGCQPPYNALENTRYEYEAIEHCREAHFNRIVERFKPKVILALGNVPLKHLWKKPDYLIEYIDSLPEDDKDEKKLKKNYLKNFLISSMRGYILPSIYGIPLIASFHPSHINQDKGRTLLGVLMQDLTQALNVARNGVPKFAPDYIHNPTKEQLEEFYLECKKNPHLPISHDIETPYTTIEQDESIIEFENQEVRDIDSIQFSITENRGFFVTWNDNNLDIIRAMLALPNPKIGWNNWKFDEININYHLGLDAIKGENHDVMWMWKWMNQDFVKTGRALQFATNFAAPEFPVWKHLAQIEKEKYGCLDVDATLRIFNYLKEVFTKMKLEKHQGQPVIAKSLWEGYMDDIVNLRPILKDMSRRGFPINPVEREKFKNLLTEEQTRTLQELQDEYPTEIRRLDPLEGYKTIPNEVIQAEELFKAAKNINNEGLFYILDNDETYNLRLARYIEKKTRKAGKTGLLVREFDIEGFKVKRYCRMDEFKPGSSQQVLKYLEYKGYKIPKKRVRGKGEVDTTDKSHLQPLWEETGDDLLYKCIYMRELDNLRNTFIDGQPLRSDNRVEAEFQYKPATGQLSTSPNIQNYAARGTKFSSKNYGQLANQLRRTVVAKSNHTLISADWSAFHINTMSFEANDPIYMRIGRIDPHSFLTAHMIKSELPSSLAKLKKKQPEDMEHAVWIKKIEIDEEAIIRLDSLDKWLDLTDEFLTKELGWIKKNYKFIRDAQAKRALLGIGFGMKVRRFYRENRYVFKSLAEPERIHKLIKKLFPKTFVEFHEYIKNLADKQTYLLTRYGSIRRFYDVYDYRLLKGPKSPKEGEIIFKNNKNQWWSRRDGASANEAVAYLPSNDAFGFAKEAMRNFWEYEKNGIIRNLVQEFGLINNIHDDLLWETPDEKVEEACKIIKEVMESPAQYLKSELCPDGLRTKVELKIGRNWAPYSNDNLLGMRGKLI